MAPLATPDIAETIPVNAQIILYASTALDPDSVNSRSVYLEDEEGRKLISDVTLLDRQIIIQPKVYLPAEETLHIIVTTEVETLSGAHLSEQLSLSFVSGDPSGDTTPPVYLGHNLSDSGATHPYSIFYFQFDEPISPLDLPGNIITVKHPDTLEVITGTISVMGSLLSFEPSTPLKTMEELGNDVGYDINVSLFGNIRDLSGNTYYDTDVQLSVIGASSAAPIVPVTSVNTNNYSTGSTVYSIEKLGNTLFVGGEERLHIVSYDLDSRSFTPLSTLSTPEMGAVYAISIDAGAKVLYLATSKGVVIVDVSDYHTPQQIGSYLTADPVYGVDYFNDHLYLAATLTGMIDLNISTPETPQHIHTYATQGTAFGVLSTPSTGYGDYASVSDFDNGMLLVNPDNNTTMDATFYDYIGQVRAVFRDQNNTSDYLALSSVGGVFRYNLGSTPPPNMDLLLSLPSYAYKLVSRRDLIFYVSLKHMGIALVDYRDVPTIMNIYDPSFETTTFTAVSDGVTEHLIIPDAQGALHAIEPN